MKPPEIPFLSSLTGRWITAEEATDPDYWCRQMREPVLFGPAAGVLLGADAWALAALAAPLLTGLCAVALAFRSTAATVPHGPSMCVAAAAAVAVVAG